MNNYINNISNINPDLWGPHGWKFLHYITLTYPNKPKQKDKENYKMFFQLLGEILPCEKCKINYKKHINETPISEKILSSKYNLIVWLINMHNKVNYINNKKQYNLEEVLDELFNKNNTSEIFGISNKIFILVIIILIILCVYMLKC